MSTPIADYEVHLQKGVRAQVMHPLSCAAEARGKGETAGDLLDLIALRMKQVHNVGDTGPDHRREEWDSVPAHLREAYRREYDSLHVEQYFSIHIRFGIRSTPPRLVIISAQYPPAMT